MTLWVSWRDLQDTAAACCESCQAAAGRGCNVWVWCGNPDGCGSRSFRECWLKRQHSMDTNTIAGQRGEGRGGWWEDWGAAVAVGVADSKQAGHAEACFLSHYMHGIPLCFGISAA